MDKVEYEFSLEKFTNDIRDACGKHAPLRELAPKVGTSASTLSRLENGNLPDMHTFIMICSNLELNPGEYFKRMVWRKVDG